MGERIYGRFGLGLCLAGALIATSLGCHPAGSSSAPANPAQEKKPNPDNKDAPNKQPPPDVG
jgi:hypothetical protein